MKYGNIPGKNNGCIRSFPVKAVARQTPSVVAAAFFLKPLPENGTIVETSKGNSSVEILFANTPGHFLFIILRKENNRFFLGKQKRRSPGDSHFHRHHEFRYYQRGKRLSQNQGTAAFAITCPGCLRGIQAQQQYGGKKNTVRTQWV